jgi:hypothetical protein
MGLYHFLIFYELSTVNILNQTMYSNEINSHTARYTDELN